LRAVTEQEQRLAELAAARARLVAWLTAAMMVLYFGFILLIAFARPLLGTLLAPGLSLGIVIGAAVIVISWALAGIYVRWANRHYDGAVAGMRDRG
jgi:uncharacterized membrane protein (DUF485 family)